MRINIRGIAVEVIQGDITKCKVDGIVNAANTSLLGGGGVDGAIHRAGGSQILDECKRIRDTQGGCRVGEAVITSAGRMQARYVIHTVGPVWNGGNKGEDSKLKGCYESVLRLAGQYNMESIAIPNISTGIYHFPKERAAEIAISSTIEYIQHNNSPSQVIFVCFDEQNYDIYTEKLSTLPSAIPRYNSFNG